MQPYHVDQSSYSSVVLVVVEVGVVIERTEEQ